MPKPKGAPIPIESLTPIAKNDPRAQVKFDGQSMPKAPSMRHVKPKPFQRARFDLDRHNREWQWCRADQVDEGDMVVGVGRVVSARVVIRKVHRAVLAGGTAPKRVKAYDMVAVGTDIELEGMGGTVVRVDAGEQVKAFRERESDTQDR